MTTSVNPPAPQKRKRGHSKKREETRVSDETYASVMEDVTDAKRRRGRRGPSIPVSESKSPWAKEVMYAGAPRHKKRTPPSLIPPPVLPRLELEKEDHEPFASLEEMLTFARPEFACVVGPEELESLELPNVYAFGPKHFDPEAFPTRAQLKRFLFRQRQLSDVGPDEKIGMFYPRSSSLLEQNIPMACGWPFVRRQFARNATAEWMIGCAPLLTGVYPLPDLRSERRRRLEPLPAPLVPWFLERALVLLLASPLGFASWHGEVELTLFAEDVKPIYLGLSFDGKAVRCSTPDLATRLCLY